MYLKCTAHISLGVLFVTDYLKELFAVIFSLLTDSLCKKKIQLTKNLLDLSA